MGTNIYDVIESWWGRPLDTELIDVVLAAPLEHLIEFRDHFYAEIEYDVPSLAPGTLRPFVAAKPTGHTKGQQRNEEWPAAHPVTPTLLLFAHEVAVEEPLSTILWRLGA